MVEYGEYINRLKKSEIGGDYDRLYKQIEHRAGRQAAIKKLTMTGAVVTFLLAIAIYLYFPFGPIRGDDTLVFYVFYDEPVDGVVLDYVFGD